MGVPIRLELHTFFLDIFKEEGVKEPDVVGIVPIEAVKPLKAGKEGPPAAGKVATSFEPHPLDPSIICGAIGIRLLFNM